MAFEGVKESVYPETRLINKREETTEATLTKTNEQSNKSETNGK